jgi:hypothetical protein
VLSTKFSLTEFESSSNFSWNLAEDLASKDSGNDSSFDAGFLRQNARAFFNSAKDIILGNVEDSEPMTHLEACMDAFGSNKGTAHNYTRVHGQIFGSATKGARGVFELGIGSNFQDGPSRMHVNYQPGASLRAWREFFDDALIVGADIDPRVLFRE